MGNIEVDNDHLKTRYANVHFIWDEKLNGYIVRSNCAKAHLGRISYYKSLKSWILYPGEGILFDAIILRDVTLFINDLEAKSWRV